MIQTKRFIGLVLFCAIALSSCVESINDDKGKSKSGYSYVKPSIDSRGRYRKGHVRKSVSTSKNAYRNQAKSRYYYQTRGKYRRKK